jgi:hypothetical protein
MSRVRVGYLSPPSRAAGWQCSRSLTPPSPDTTSGGRSASSRPEHQILDLMLYPLLGLAPAPKPSCRGRTTGPAATDQAAGVVQAPAGWTMEASRTGRTGPSHRRLRARHAQPQPGPWKLGVDARRSGGPTPTSLDPVVIHNSPDRALMAAVGCHRQPCGGTAPFDGLAHEPRRHGVRRRVSCPGHPGGLDAAPSPRPAATAASLTTTPPACWAFPRRGRHQQRCVDDPVLGAVRISCVRLPEADAVPSSGSRPAGTNSGPSTSAPGNRQVPTQRPVRHPRPSRRSPCSVARPGSAPPTPRRPPWRRRGAAADGPSGSPTRPSRR